ncbi:3-oxoacyl-[acyl-carrier protein] reductase [Candidatus Magnetomorum sp. HK-1]|nr:3-oxoacyl-[acyl-carrier protein] reductase [Candidatus Magnetomorum sp. HK-1]
MTDKNTHKIAIVTGGSRGIGRAIVQILAESGMEVFFNYSSSDNSDAIQTQTAVEKNGGVCKGFRVDISNHDEVQNFIRSIVKQSGGVHVLVNNAGIKRDGLLAMMSETHWDNVINVNLRGAYLCTKAVLKPMIRQRWGRIVNISSVVGITGNAGQSNYAAAKAGLIGFTKSVAQEVASRQITANVVAPGFIQTQMTDELDDSQQQLLFNQIPMKRMGTPKDVASVVRFLASNDAEYMTGQVLHVCGGLTM